MIESPGVDRLVELIAERVDPSGGWSLSSEQTIDALGVDRVPYWRAVHALRDRVAFGDAVDGFGAESAGDLVMVLESLCGPSAEAALTRAGLFLPHGTRIALMEELADDARAFSESQPVDEEELAAMLRFAGSTRPAIEIYFGQHVDFAALIERRAAAFQEASGMPEVGRRTAERYLRSLVSRHVIDATALFVALELRLRRIARGLGYGDPQDPQPDDGAHRREAGGVSPRLARARAVLGLPASPTSFAQLRRRYRELVRQYHPDVNPAGLERCKEITAAYALLCASEGTPPRE